MEKIRCLLDPMSNGEAPQFFSGPVQVDAAAMVEEDDELRGGGSAQACRCVAERGGRREGKRGNGKRAA